MSLKKKIVLSFFISSFIIALLAAFDYASFLEIRKEIRYLEVTDTISRKSLQLRRHEKNYFLYSPHKADEESAAVHLYLAELKGLLAQSPNIDRADNLSLRDGVHEYERRFKAIEASAKRLNGIFEKTRMSYRGNEMFFSLVEATFLERPVQSADFLEAAFRLPQGHALVAGLRELDTEIAALRKTGEELLVISKDLDKLAREKAETVIRVSQVAILVVFPLFFLVGVGTLFFISTSVVRRLMLLINVVEKTGKGTIAHIKAPVREWGNDEVGLLIRKFDDMEDELEVRHAELERKNRELMQAQKLAAIGTLAAGVAHELNNPLNNIYLTTQVLSREAREVFPPEMQELLDDILSQTTRVKKIVADLLEFARGREPQLRAVELGGLIRGAFSRVRPDAEEVAFSFSADAAETMVQADHGQMEQVFINLFSNAVEAMAGRGELNVMVMSTEDRVTIRVQDTGRGIPREALDTVFEPFFTTKDKGTGLGLAIVYNIVRKHRGELAVSSEEGKGTTFTITLPGGTTEHGL
jgi:signal transduction histidine kinase